MCCCKHAWSLLLLSLLLKTNQVCRGLRLQRSPLCARLRMQVRPQASLQPSLMSCLPTSLQLCCVLFFFRVCLAMSSCSSFLFTFGSFLIGTALSCSTFCTATATANPTTATRAYPAAPPPSFSPSRPTTSLSPVMRPQVLQL